MISSKPNIGFGVSYNAEVEGKLTVSAIAASVCFPKPKRRDCGGSAFTTTGFRLEGASSVNTFFRKSSTAFIRVLRLILASLSFYKTNTFFV